MLIVYPCGKDPALLNPVGKLHAVLACPLPVLELFMYNTILAIAIYGMHGGLIIATCTYV